MLKCVSDFLGIGNAVTKVVDRWFGNIPLEDKAIDGAKELGRETISKTAEVAKIGIASGAKVAERAVTGTILTANYAIGHSASLLHRGCESLEHVIVTGADEVKAWGRFSRWHVADWSDGLRGLVTIAMGLGMVVVANQMFNSSDQDIVRAVTTIAGIGIMLLGTANVAVIQGSKFIARESSPELGNQTKRELASYKLGMLERGNIARKFPLVAPPEIRSLLLDASSDCTTLMQAAKSGNLATLARLQGEGVQLEQQDSSGKTALGDEVNANQLLDPVAVNINKLKNMLDQLDIK